jgi:hypothetical protein
MCHKDVLVKSHFFLFIVVIILIVIFIVLVAIFIFIIIFAIGFEAKPERPTWRASR